MKSLHNETREKVPNGYSKVIIYRELKKNLRAKLKNSPVAMIPHKSQSYCKILDLSFQILHRGKIIQSVNSATVKQAPSEEMIHMGQCVQRLIATLLGNYDKNNPFNFAKLDIKDVFWRLSVSDTDVWNFCYVLPQDNKVKNIEDIEVVVPNCL